MDFIKPSFRQWAKHSSDLGFTDFVSPEDSFETELSGNQTWANRTRSGIYTWITDTGEAYVGKAVNVRSRLKQHWRSYRSIAYAAFQPVEQEELDKEERRLIVAMETKFPVLNIAFARSSTTTVPFDQVVTLQERQQFLSGANLAEDLSWSEWTLLQRKQINKFEVLTSDDLYCIALRALRIYVERCIPKPKSTEVKFWSVTILNESPHYFRINVGQQEVFTLWMENTLFARILATEKLLDDAKGPFYVTNSYDNSLPILELDSWLVEKNLIACRELVTWLMRHTVPIHSRSHCPQFVRAAFADPTPSPC
jgi:hypothetical protein